MARSVSRWPPWAAGSTSHGRPSASQSRLPDHRSPWMRAGGSGGPASSAIRSQTRSMHALAVGRQRRVVAGTAAPAARRRRSASRRRGSFDIGSGPMKPRPRRAERRAAPKACIAATARPAASCAAGVHGPWSIRVMAMWSGPTDSTSGTGAPASASHRSPRASASKKPARRVGAALLEDLGGHVRCVEQPSTRPLDLVVHVGEAVGAAVVRVADLDVAGGHGVGVELAQAAAPCRGRRRRAPAPADRAGSRASIASSRSNRSKSWAPHLPARAAR